MRLQIVDGRLDRDDCVRGGGRIVRAQKLERAFDVEQRSRGVDYLRHGFGRAAESSTASRFIQACTSSARYTSPDFSISASAASLLDEAAHLFLVVGVPLHRLDDEAMGRSSRLSGEGAKSRTQFRRQPDCRGVGHGYAPSHRRATHVAQVGVGQIFIAHQILCFDNLSERHEYSCLRNNLYCHFAPPYEVPI